MGDIPQSNALAEASPDSLSELLSRDPMGFQKQDRQAIVAALRAQRVKWEAAEAAAASKPKAPRGSMAVAKTLVASAAPEDLGL